MTTLNGIREIPVFDFHDRKSIARKDAVSICSNWEASTVNNYAITIVKTSPCCSVHMHGAHNAHEGTRQLFCIACPQQDRLCSLSCVVLQCVHLSCHVRVHAVFAVMTYFGTCVPGFVSVVALVDAIHGSLGSIFHLSSKRTASHEGEETQAIGNINSEINHSQWLLSSQWRVDDPQFLFFKNFPAQTLCVGKGTTLLMSQPAVRLATLNDRRCA